YMLPTTYTSLAQMPLTTSGKLNRKALPVPGVITSAHEYVAPRTPTEEVLAAIWQDVLKRETIGVYDNFFELGGHSLLATQLVSRIRKHFEVELQVRLLFTDPTLQALAKQIDRALQVANGVIAPPITSTSRYTDLPLSFAQQRLWFLDQINPKSSLFNVPMFMRLNGPLNIAKLFDTFNEVVQRHEVLRTVFTSIAGQPLQIIKPQFFIPLPVIDLSGLSNDVVETNISKLADTEAKRPFVLYEGPLLRTTLLKLGSDEHIILMTMHHIVSDGWSMGVLIQELSILYNALSRGQQNPLPPLTIQYADFAQWQRNWLQGQALEQQLGFWREQLEGAPGLLELPTDRQRPPVQSHRGSSVYFTIEKSLAKQIKTLCSEQGASAFMTIMTALHILLSKLSGQQDICVGTPIANRNYQELEPLIGFFINTLVIRSHQDDRHSFRQLLSDVRERTLSAYSHQDFPFEQLVDELNIPRDMSYPPLYQVSFSFHNMPQPGLQASEIRLCPLATPMSMVKSEIELHITESSNGFSGHWSYAVDLFDESTIDRWSNSFLYLLKQIVANPDASLRELSLLTHDQQQKIVAQWNNTSKAHSSPFCIHQLFEARVALNPHADALLIGDQSMSYGELNRRSNQLAHYIRSQGASPDKLIGVYTDRSFDAIIAILGILKSGCAYVPLDPDSPQERLVSTLKDAHARMLITDSNMVQNLPDLPARVLNQLSYRELVLDTEWSKIESCSEEDPTNINVPGNLAYVIYTSGSTGQPKGVQIQHGSLCNLVHAQSASFNHKQNTRYLQFSSLSFDASVSDIFCTLISGGMLCIASQTQRHSIDEMKQWMTSQNINAATFPPSVLTAMGSHLSLPQLKTLIVAGEACPASLVNQWAPHCDFFNAYGPTETTVCASLTLCDESEQAPSIGYPINNVNIYILDRHLNPVPIGVVGELYIAGAGLARGYLNKFQLTAEYFIPDPFNTVVGARMYRTGDLARYLDDGQIEYKGRVDHQVKLRGFRIELGEIEATLRSHPAIAEAVVLATEGELADKRLSAYLIAQAGTEIPDATDLRAFVQKYLPGHMVPNTFTNIDQVPVTISGKLDRKRLLETVTAEKKTTFVSPRNAIEKTIADVAMEILKVENVGIHDNFFELGGHSLLATQFISKIQDQLQVRLNVSVLFENPTVEKVAAYIETIEQIKLDSSIFDEPAEDNAYQEVEL
ncbi:MAG: amino acid adenylation domain-containing protein, partial [Gammaproteobacteria bacterium]|nr:amino acid adenylation domain-containing protein [Gammaproteobacteria bacterium]